MKEEVAAAVVFVTRLVKRNKNLSKEECEKFSDKLTNILVDRFKNHWHPEKPLKGQAYRCIRINEFEPTDSVLQQAALESGLNFHQLCLPSELTLWVDPSEVCCRFGETKGSCITVASFKKDKTDNHALTLNVDDMVDEYNKKKTEEINKLREYTGKRSPVNTPPNSSHIYKSGPYNMLQQTKWRNPHYNLNRVRPFYGHSQMIRSDCVYYPSSIYDEDVVMDGGESVISSTYQQVQAYQPTAPPSSIAPTAMKTGHTNQQSNSSSNNNNKGDRYRWVKGPEAVKA